MKKRRKEGQELARNSRFFSRSRAISLQSRRIEVGSCGSVLVIVLFFYDERSQRLLLPSVRHLWSTSRLTLVRRVEEERHEAPVSHFTITLSN
jgi:hypothetical protein